MRSLRHLTLAAALALTACDPPAPPQAPSPQAGPAPSAVASSVTSEGSPASLPSAASSAPAATAVVEEPPLAPPANELQAFAQRDNAFAFDCYARVRRRKGNLVVSPFSIATALGMAWAGARGETAAQMGKVLHLAGPPDRALALAGSLVAGYGKPGQKVTLRIANQLFGEKTHAFEKPYLATMKAAFGAPLEPLDFKGAADESRRHINAWVAARTGDHIKDLIPSEGVDGKTRLAIVNAIYFEGDWASAFARASTTPAPFFAGKGDPKDVPTMHQDGAFRFAATDGVEILELPYQGGALVMDFVLPDAVDGLDALEARLTPGVFERWMLAASSAHVDVSLPRIEISPADPLLLGDTLAAMGMPLAFDAARADFTGIANPPDPADRLHVSSVFHRAFVKMNEKGTVAAAATAALMSGDPFSPNAGAPFRANHPFLFFLRDVRSGLVLFMGRVADPADR